MKSGASSVESQNRRDDLGTRRLLTVREASEYLGVSNSTLYGWAWQRRIPYVKIGRALRFDLNELEQFINSNRVPARRVRITQGEQARNCYNTRAAGKGMESEP